MVAGFEHFYIEYVTWFCLFTFYILISIFMNVEHTDKPQCD